MTKRIRMNISSRICASPIHTLLHVSSEIDDLASDGRNKGIRQLLLGAIVTAHDDH
jgi:hypothetical protein